MVGQQNDKRLQQMATTTTSVTITISTNILYDIVEIKTKKGKQYFEITLNKNVVIAVGSLVVGFVSEQKFTKFLKDRRIHM